MWQSIRTALLLFAGMTLLTGLVYPLAVTGVAQWLFPRQANGSLVSSDGPKSASALVGQPFRGPRYFWGRPSATVPVVYNGAASAGSNLGPANPVLVESVKGRIAALLAADPGNPLPVPVDLVTASGSGLDPHISPAAALYQVPRIARVRGVTEKEVEALVRVHIRGRQFGLLGEPTVHVWLLNAALDAGPRFGYNDTRRFTLTAAED